MVSLREGLREILRESNPMTVRQVFYQAVGRGLIDKSERAYKGIVVRLLGLMRVDGDIPYGYLVDHTRFMRKPRTFTGLQNLMESAAATYRRDLWQDQNAYVEVWLEKDALSGVVYGETDHYDVPLMVTRGYPSLSFLSEAAEEIRRQNKPTFIYYFGDLDPSGKNISEVVERKLRQLAEDTAIHFERVAVNRDQIASMSLPTRPTKKTDSRAMTFDGESVELDAIPPDELRSMVAGCIEQHINRDKLRRMREVEELEREALAHVRLPKVGSTRKGDED